MLETLESDAPAKINLRLEIIRKRKDGYHEIRTLLQKISLHDRLRFSLKRRRGIRIATDHPSLPTGRGNLVYQAILSMIGRSDYRGGVEVSIEKNIPLGAGLGGGSSNAAAAIEAVNYLLKINLNRKELMEVGAKIGADVPFFLFEGSALGSGIGERLRKMTLPPLGYVLIYPNFEVSTRWAYQNFILTKTKYHFNLHGLLKSPVRIARFLRNDLEGIVSKKYPEISLMKGMLVSAGAMGAMMTGSGPTVFGLFSTKEEATEAYRKMKRKVGRKGWKIIKAHGIP